MEIVLVALFGAAGCVLRYGLSGLAYRLAGTHEILRKREFAGATVLRGIAGFGPHSVYHTEKILRLSRDLPIIIEVVDTIERIESLIPELDEIVKEGLVTIEKARVIRYTHKHKNG